MNDKPDMLYEMGARTHGVFLLLFFAVIWVGAVAFALVLSVPGWWAVCWIAAATLTVAIVAGQVIPFMVRGGTYRVVVQDEWLRSESPHPALGLSFTVALPSITKLVVHSYNEGLDSYEVHTQGGESFPLPDPVGAWVFKAIQQLHPEIPLERRG
jgi:hypothetical protein